MVFKFRDKLGYGGNICRKVLSGILALAILGVLGTLIYVIASPNVGEKFTEFYLLGLGGKAEGYPSQLTVGEEGRVVVGIINKESETVTYWVEVRINGVVSEDLEPRTLEHGEKWEEIVGFIPDRAEDNQKVEFLLHKQGHSGVYRGLYFWVDVQ